jgi:hypothetical protein
MIIPFQKLGVGEAVFATNWIGKEAVPIAIKDPLYEVVPEVYPIFSDVLELNFTTTPASIVRVG